ncbi:hypothetical protein NVS89_15715 [Ancylobacter sp. MQZ15Z-1]|uniref:Permease n=1 Tax=Ancylobacter mangrovi TaxID=2972472 RepID=A0A9X2PFR6_9HYPH|nr:hypothetical protein [Ancylobacter mangrovi]MCS0496549.1 hypothetical protein [Ancylobacter mangrovi]
MNIGLVIMACLATGTFIAVLVRQPGRLKGALAQVGRQGGSLAVRIPMALYVASSIEHFVPTEAIGPVIGEGSGWKGILLASAFGAFVPGGPMVTFPLALTVWQMGAGRPQIIAFLASWSIFAVHRILSYELPLMGSRFVLTRLSASWYLPPLAGALAWMLIALSGLWTG